ncbi:MAG: hypothetical protein ACRDS0_04535 [Pseudonocardiaceae bacterium]
MFCWVEQVAEHPESGALFSRLHQRGQVVGRGTHLVYVRLDHGGQLIALRPHHLRIVEAPSGC